MEQYVLKVPFSIAGKLQRLVDENALEDAVAIHQGNNRHFTFTFQNQSYPALLVDLPCVSEIHKSYDNRTFYKSGDIGQMLVVFENKDEQDVYEREELGEDGLISGFTPPTTNIVKRKWAKTQKQKSFPPEEVGKVEEAVEQAMRGFPYEEVHEEIVTFEEYMVDEANPNGRVIFDEVTFLKENPEAIAGIGETLKQGLEIAASPELLLEAGEDIPANMSGTPEESGNDDGDMSDLEEELFGDLEADSAEESSSKTPTVQEPPESLTTTKSATVSTAPVRPVTGNPRIQQLLDKKRAKELKLVEADRDVNELKKKISNMKNIVVKMRFEKNLEAANAHRRRLQEEIAKIEEEMRNG